MYKERVRDLLSWTYEGVDNTLPGNGGEDCINFISPRQRIIETVIFSIISIYWLVWSWRRIDQNMPAQIPVTANFDNIGKKILLTIHVFVFGIEIGFKFATRQMIWILNPCHLVTMTQIYLLVAPPSKLNMKLFRVMIHSLQGATIALLFPVVNTRVLCFETETYYIQHGLMLVIPFYLLRMRGMYQTEPYSDYSYVFLAAGVLYVYHWTGLQYLAYTTHVNLNNMMCPAVSDPFYGQWYRVFAFIHQTTLILAHGKLYTYICDKCLPERQTDFNNKPPKSLESNGHAKLH